MKTEDGLHFGLAAVVLGGLGSASRSCELGFVNFFSLSPNTELPVDLFVDFQNRQYRRLFKERFN